MLLLVMRCSLATALLQRPPPYASKKNAVESYPDGILRFLYKLIQKSFRQLLLSTRLFGRRICLNSRIISLHEWTAEKKHRKMAKNQFFFIPKEFILEDSHSPNKSSLLIYSFILLSSIYLPIDAVVNYLFWSPVKNHI